MKLQVEGETIFLNEIKTTAVTWHLKKKATRVKVRQHKMRNEKDENKYYILSMSKVRWQGALKITSGTYAISYSGGTEHQRGMAIVWEQDMGKIA